MSDYSSKKVAELKELLSARGLAVSGNKADLVARLEEADKAIPADKAAATAEAGAAADAAVDAAVEETSSATATAPEVIEVAKTEESAPAADAAAAAAAVCVRSATASGARWTTFCGDAATANGPSRSRRRSVSGLHSDRQANVERAVAQSVCGARSSRMTWPREKDRVQTQSRRGPRRKSPNGRDTSADTLGDVECQCSPNQSLIHNMGGTTVENVKQGSGSNLLACLKGVT